MKNNPSKGGSMIKRGFAAFTSWIYAMAAGGIFGNILTSYGRMNEKFKSSFIVSCIGNGSRMAAAVRGVRFKIAEMFDHSAMLWLWKKVANFLVGCKLRFYGSFTLIFAIYTILIYLVKRFAFSVNYSDNSYIICASILLLAAIPMIVSKKTLAQTLLESRAGHRLVVDILGIPEEKLKVDAVKHGDSYNLAIIAGLAVGTITYFISPVAVIAFFAAILVIALVMTYPEIGVFLTLLLLPFFGYFGDRTQLLLSFVLLYSFAYLIKLIRIKRILKAELYDISVLAFGAVVLLGGLVSLGGESSLESARIMVTMLIGGFVALNLIRTAEWINRCAWAVFCAGFTVSVLLIISFVTSRVGLADIGLNIDVSFLQDALMFDDANALAAYLVAAFAITVSALGTLKNRRIRFIFKLGLISMPAAVLSVSSKSGVLGMIVAVLAYCFFVKRKTLAVLIGTAAVGAYAGYMLPRHWFGTISAGIEIIFNSLVNTVYVWQGVVGIIASSLFAGVGIDTFETVFPRFAVAGTENAAQSASLFLSMLCDIGLPGLLIFLCAVLLVVQKSFEYMKDPIDKSSKLAVAGGLSAVCAILGMGLFYDVFCDMSIFYMFWFVAAYTVSRVRIGKSEAFRKINVFQSNESNASVDI